MPSEEKDLTERLKLPNSKGTSSNVSQEIKPQTLATPAIKLKVEDSVQRLTSF